MEIEALRLNEPVDVGNERTSYFAMPKYKIMFDSQVFTIKLLEPHSRDLTNSVCTPISNSLWFRPANYPKSVPSPTPQATQTQSNKKLKEF